MSPEITERFAQLAELEYPRFFADNKCQRCGCLKDSDGVTHHGLSCAGNDWNYQCECRCHILQARFRYRKGNLDPRYYPSKELADQLTEALANMQAAEAQLQQARAKQERWIPVGDRLPEDGQQVLCFVTRRKRMNPQNWIDLLYYSLEFGFDPEDQSNGGPVVTHWRPLPAAPATEGGGDH